MKDIRRNLGFDDRGVRSFLALIISILYATYVIHAWWGDLILYLGLYLLITSMMAFDPFYYFRDFTTKDPYDY